MVLIFQLSRVLLFTVTSNARNVDSVTSTMNDSTNAPHIDLPADSRRVVVLDTSVLLSDPRALLKFAEHRVVLPVVVVTELEAKRHHGELGYFARTALRMLDDLRIDAGRLDIEVPLNDIGGTLCIDLHSASTELLPVGMRLGDNDTRILACAMHHSSQGSDVTVVTKDLPLRVKASALGLDAEEYRAEFVVDTGWMGVVDVDFTDEQMQQLYDKGSVFVEGLSDDKGNALPCNTGLRVRSLKGSALGRILFDGSVKLVRGDRDIFGMHGRSAEQRLAIDMLLDPNIGIVSLGGRAGTGKSALALCAGLEAVLEREQHSKVMVFRPLYAVGGQELGYLPGDANEKMNPWAQAVFDTLGAMVSREVVEEVLDRELLEVLPLTHIRGRSLHDAFVIVDEAQSLERNVLLTMLSRVGQNSRVVLTHDVAQRDNLRVGRHDGIAAVTERLKGHRLFGHITLTRSERSEIADLVTSLLDNE